MPLVGWKSNGKLIGIVGSRRRNRPDDYFLLRRSFDLVYVKGDAVVSGGCKTGADFWAECICRGLGIKPLLHKPEFDRYGIPQCYFERNTLIARDCSVLLAVVASDRTGGTEDTVRKALGFGKRVWLVEGADSPIFRAV